MVTIADIGWGGYDVYEGPFFRGSIKHALPPVPDFMDKVLAVVTSTEGGAYDAINMYDRCIVSVGLIQWCEAGAFAVSTILGRCNELDSFMVQNSLNKFPVPVELKKNKAGLYRFFSKGIEVNVEAMQRQLYLGDSAMGKKGTWTNDTKVYAKTVAAWFANFWDYPLFRTAQAEYTKLRMPGFLMAEARQTLFTGMGEDDKHNWGGALRAAYYSFAANLPSVANKSLIKATQDAAWGSADSADRFRLALQYLTFAPGISIYPARYEAIAPVLNRLFGTSAPLKAADLKTWDDAPPDNIAIELTDGEKTNLARLVQLSNTLSQGGGEGIDAITPLVEDGKP